MYGGCSKPATYGTSNSLEKTFYVLIISLWKENTGGGECAPVDANEFSLLYFILVPRPVAVIDGNGGAGSFE